MPLGQFFVEVTSECFDYAQRQESSVVVLAVRNFLETLVLRAALKAPISLHLNAQFLVLGAILAAFEAAQTV